MTPYAHQLVLLTGAEDWDALGDDWRFDVVADLWWVDSFTGAPDWLLEQSTARTLDWGAVLYEVSLDQVKRLCPRPPFDWLQDGWQHQVDMLEALDPDERYGVIWIEEGEAKRGPGQRWEQADQSPPATVDDEASPG